MITTSGSQPMTLRLSWRSTLETWAVQAVAAVDHVVAGEGQGVAVAVAKPLGRSVWEGLTR